MNEKKLSMDNLTAGSRSYVDCLYSLLTTAGFFPMPKYMLSGMTGMLFKFVVHKRLLPSSLDMYSWQRENWKAVNMLGIYTETYSGSPMDPTFPLCREQAIRKIITSINEGRAAIGWGHENPRFCLYTGYNEEDRVIFCRDSRSKEEEVLLYDNFGLIDEGDWFLQIIGDKVERDIRDIYRESMEDAVREWHTEYKEMPEYGAGKRAYQNLLDAFHSRVFNYNGAYYILELYLDSKINISRYMDAVILEIPELTEVTEIYHKLSDIISPLKALELSGKPENDMKYIPMAAELFQEAMQLEDRAVTRLEKYLENYLHNRRVNPARLKDLY